MPIEIFPILIPVVFMILHLFIKSHRYAGLLGITGSTLLLLTAVMIIMRVDQFGILTENAGGWEAPFGISIVIDQMSALFLLASSVILLAISIYALYLKEQKTYLSKFYLFFFSLIL